MFRFYTGGGKWFILSLTIFLEKLKSRRYLLNLISELICCMISAIFRLKNSWPLHIAESAI